MKNIKTTATTENKRTVTGMDKYINREALIEWLKHIPLIDLSDGRGLCRVIMEDDFKKAIKKMPKGIIADVAPVKHGRWIHTDLAVHWYGKDECNECTYHAHDRSDLSHFNYCPNCGAKMDGGAD